jgi:hypothetical protein
MWLKKLMRREPLPDAALPFKRDVEEMYGLLMAKEPSHGSGVMRRDLVYSMMTIDLMAGKKGKRGRSFERTIGPGGVHPSAAGGAPGAGRRVTEEIFDPEAAAKKKLTPKAKTKRDERRKRERATIKAWFDRNKKDLPVFKRKPTLKDVENFVRDKMRELVKGK